MLTGMEFRTENKVHPIVMQLGNSDNAEVKIYLRQILLNLCVYHPPGKKRIFF